MQAPSEITQSCDHKYNYSADFRLEIIIIIIILFPLVLDIFF